MKPTQEPEGLDRRKVVAAGAVLAVLSVLSVVAAWLSLVPTRGALDRGQPRPAATFGEPGGVETYLFSTAPAPSARAAAARERLERYGWVDRDAGIVHVPIERAMELYLVEGRSAERIETDPGGGT